MIDAPEAVAHTGLAILSEALSRARTEAALDAGPIRALGYACTPGAEALADGRWQAIVQVQGRGELFTVVGKAFATAEAAHAHAANATLIELYDGDARG